MVTIELSNSTQTEQKRCDDESGFVRKRIDRRVGTRIVSTSVIKITLKRSSVYTPVQRLFSETGLLVRSFKTTKCQIHLEGMSKTDRNNVKLVSNLYLKIVSFQ